MRRSFLLFVAVSFAGFATNAQTTSFGLKAGMTAANMKAHASGINITTSTKIGFYAGAMAEIGISENFAVQPELYYSLMGGKMNLDFGGETFSGTDELGYINLPVLLKYKSEGFSAFLGPQIGYLVSAKSKSGGETEDVKSEMNSTDFSGIIGVGYTLSNGVGFDARYQMGFANIAKEAEGEGTVKNNAFMVGIHYFFNR